MLYVTVKWPALKIKKKKVKSAFLSKAPFFLKEYCFMEGSQASAIGPSGKNNV